MRIIYILLTVLCISLVNTAAFANVTPKITLYAAPSNTAKQIGKIDLSQSLIPIYRQKKWIKVGDPNNGNVGWINVDQYNKVVAAYTKMQTKTIYVQADKDARTGKQKLIVYENGKKVADKRAQEIYRQMQKEQVKTEAQFKKMQQQMDKMMQDFGAMPDMMPLPTPPIVVVVEPSKS